MTTISYPEAARDFPAPDVTAYTRAHEVQVLMWLIAQTAGSMVEIGCNAGHTTRQLASAFSDRTVFAVDCFTPPTLKPEQRCEIPAAANFCALARDLPNVRALLCDSARLSLDELANIGFVFIDGDHSYEGVKADSENALRYFDARAAQGKSGIIAWHDAFANPPAWCGVWHYLEKLHAAGRAITLIESTWVAYLHIGPETHPGAWD